MVFFCAASSAYALRRCVLDNPVSSLVYDTVMKSFYVDDCLRSVKCVSDLRELVFGVKDALRKGGMDATKCIVNDGGVLSEIPEEDRAEEVKDILPEAVLCKALGVRWSIVEDQFRYVSRLNANHEKVTRRVMVSQIARVYDPLGLVTPAIHRGKVLMQEACRLQLPWDAEVPPPLERSWLAWVDSMGEVDSLKFERCLVPAGFEDGVAELHVFSDASLSGFGACTY